MVTVFLAFGANLNQPLQQIQQAYQRLSNHPLVDELQPSSFYKSKPLGPTDQPDFYNSVARITTELSPLQLLEEAQKLEQLSNRQRLRHWGERTLDVDIIHYQGTEVTKEWQSAKLTLPHPHFAKRDFVLLPLQEVLDKTWDIDINRLISQLTEHFIYDKIAYESGKG